MPTINNNLGANMLNQSRLITIQPALPGTEALVLITRSDMEYFSEPDTNPLWPTIATLQVLAYEVREFIVDGKGYIYTLPVFPVLGVYEPYAMAVRVGDDRYITPQKGIVTRQRATEILSQYAHYFSENRKHKCMEVERESKRASTAPETAA